MLSKNEILSKISQDKNYTTIARNITKGNKIYIDLVQDAFVILLGLDEVKLQTLYTNDELKFYFAATVRNAYYQQHKRNKIDLIENYGNIEIIEDESEVEIYPEEVELIVDKRVSVEDIFNEEMGYEKTLLRLSVEAGSIRAAAKNIGIMERDAQRSIKKLKEHLKNKYGEV